jgi:putative oxidoreductase
LLSIVRIFVALFFLQHGLSTYLGFPAPSPANFQPLTLIGLAGVIEIVGGVLLALGLYTRQAAFVMLGEMAVAYFMSRPARGFFPLVNGGESRSGLQLFLLHAAPGRRRRMERRPPAPAVVARPVGQHSPFQAEACSGDMARLCNEPRANSSRAPTPASITAYATTAVARSKARASPPPD